MRVAVAFDHRGVKLRERLLEELAALGHETVDLGTDKPEPRIDYPDKAREVAEAIRSGDAERARARLRLRRGRCRGGQQGAPGSARRSATTHIPRTRG